MLELLAEWLNLSPQGAILAFGGVLAAGVVRGFSGFALTATIMAALVLILPPVELIPVCLILEGVATIFMLRSGLREANLPMVAALSVGTLLGVPIGLAITTTVSPDLSSMLAQSLVLVLALAQILQYRPTWLLSVPARYGAGAMAGVAAGLAGVGGMVIALFVLVQQAPPRVMRGSLVVFLFISLVIGGGYQISFGVMTELALQRALVLAPVAVIGVLLGKQLFRPGLESGYRRFCLTLLIALASIGLFKTGVIG